MRPTVNPSTKGAIVALSIIVSLTATKFILYAVSGSIAVFSEAWHSFADIATTLLVLVSIVRQARKSSRRGPADPEPVSEEAAAYDAGAYDAGANDAGAYNAGAYEADTQPGTRQTYWQILGRSYRWLRGVNTELKIAVAISIVLISAAVMILWRALTAGPIQINAPLSTGLVFVGLSFGSFFLYRFEERMGKTERSAALTADSHHNRADMAISLLTGISLIIYHFGANIDRWVGLLIALYILAFSSELLVNAILSIRHEKEDLIFHYRFTAILQRAFQADPYQHLFRQIDHHIHLGQRVKALLSTIPVLIGSGVRWGIRIGLVTSVAAYVATMVFTVKPDEKALRLRFGRLLDRSSAVEPGIHWKLPFPIDTVLRFETAKIRTLSVGNASATADAMIWTREHGDTRTFISGDNNLFLPYIVIHFRIKNIHDYYLTNRNGVPEEILASAAYRLLNQVFARTSFYDLILDRRAAWTAALKASLQAESDRLRTGLDIIDFYLKDLHPPVDLAGAYEDVVAANQMKATFLNDALRQENFLLSQTRMETFKTIREAESYVVEKKATAQGEAANYLLRYAGYKSGGETMKNLLLLKAAEKTLKDKKVFLVDPKSGIDRKMIYIENHMAGRKK
jgi:membrane protease subunit HflK